MARCSCAGGACSCSIQAGGGLSVAGVGSSANPFIISLAPTPGSVTSEDGTLDLSVLGASATSDVLLLQNVTNVLLPANGVRLDLLVTQDGVGGRTITWPSEVSWPGGAAPVLTVAAGAVDWISLIRGETQWAGVRLGANLS